MPDFSGPSVLAMLHKKGEFDGCHAWRIWQPFAALERHQYPAWWAWNGDPDIALQMPALRGHSIGEIAEAIVLPRMTWQRKYRDSGLRWFDAMHRAGKPVICEFDDDLFSHDLWLREVELHKQTPETADDIIESHIWAVQQCDGVTVTGPELAALVQQYTDRPVCIVPNAIDLDWFRAVQSHTRRLLPENQLTVGWFGGTRPDKDVEAMAVAWGRIARRYRHVKFVIYGHKPDMFWRYVDPKRIVVIPWVDVREYPAGLKNIDIGCAAVSDTPFNKCKSPIKLYEYTVSGAPVVVSPTLYGGMVNHGVDGFIAHTADEWESALSRLIEDRSLRRQMNRRLLHRVEKRHSLEGNVHRWPDAWREIMSDYRARQIRKWFVPETPRVPLVLAAAS